MPLSSDLFDQGHPFFGEEMKTCGDNSNTNHNDKLKLFEHQ